MSRAPLLLTRALASLLASLVVAGGLAAAPQARALSPWQVNLPLVALPAPSRLIAFNSGGNSPLPTGGQICILTVGANPPEQSCLPGVNRELGAPRWSPDGTRLLYDTYVWRCGPTICPNVVYLAEPGGAEPRPLTAAVWNTYSPAWSPSGAQVALIGQPSASTPSQAYIVDADGTDPRPAFDPQALSGYGLLTTQIIWSPDGSRVAALFSRGDELRLCLAAVADGATVCLPQMSNLYGVLSWSPDGREIAVATTVRDGAAGLYAVPVDGSAPRKLADCTACWLARWSPDGERVIFTDGQLGLASRLFSVGADGSGRAALTPEGTVVHHAEWSPDGIQIAVTVEEDPYTPRIYTMGRNGEGLAPLVYGRHPDWRP